MSEEGHERYEICVEGHLEPGRSVWFGGLELEHLEDGTTQLTGPVADQAALHGILARIRDLNLKLIAVRRV